MVDLIIAKLQRYKAVLTKKGPNPEAKQIWQSIMKEIESQPDYKRSKELRTALIELKMHEDPLDVIAQRGSIGMLSMLSLTVDKIIALLQIHAQKNRQLVA